MRAAAERHKKKRREIPKLGGDLLRHPWHVRILEALLERDISVQFVDEGVIPDLSEDTREEAISSDDLAIESALLGHVVKVHPRRITIADATRELEGENPHVERKDAIERAPQELSGVGLLPLTEDEFLEPTGAALRSGGTAQSMTFTAQPEIAGTDGGLCSWRTLK